MTGALVILAALILVGLLLYLTDVKYFRHHHSAVDNHNDMGNKVVTSSNTESPEICCGMHLVCEKTSLSIVSDEIVYYDDEELDRFAGRDARSYSPSETDEFRDILLTLLPQDIAGWAKSITLRKIELPPEIKDELLLLLSEIRNTPYPRIS